MPVDIFVSDEHVAIHLSGLDSVWALKSRLILSMDDVVSARVTDREQALDRVSRRLGGAHVPGTATAGTYRLKEHHDERAFVSVYRDDRVLEIETRLDDPRFVILQHPDVHELAWLIGERVA